MDSGGVGLRLVPNVRTMFSMASRALSIIDDLAAWVSSLDADAVGVTEAPALWKQLDRVERLVAAAKTIIGPKVAESGEWKRQGFATPADHLAATGGTTPGAARRQLETGEALNKLPVLYDAMVDGSVSADQAALIGDAAAANPSAQDALIDEAKKGSMRSLRHAAGRAKAAADPDPDATYRRIHAKRCLHTGTDADGTWHLHAQGTVADGARVEQALDRLTREQFTRARRDGRREPRDAYAFDALVAMAEADAPSTPKRTNIRHLALLRLDLEALRRGYVEGEGCARSPGSDRCRCGSPRSCWANRPSSWC